MKASHKMNYNYSEILVEKEEVVHYFTKKKSCRQCSRRVFMLRALLLDLGRNNQLCKYLMRNNSLGTCNFTIVSYSKLLTWYPYIRIKKLVK